LIILLCRFIEHRRCSGHDPQRQVGHDKKSKDTDLVKSHPSIMDDIELLALDLVEFTVHPVDPVGVKGDKEKPPEQDAHIQCRAPCQRTP
jgi:hypothetical protein